MSPLMWRVATTPPTPTRIAPMIPPANMAQSEALRTPPAMPPRTATMLANARSPTNQFASSIGPCGPPKAAY
jgi:hypothetical protein